MFTAVALSGCAVDRTADNGTTGSGPAAGSSPAAESSPSAQSTTSGEAAVALTPEVQAQVDYLLANFEATSSDEYGHLPDTDCVNFTSQSLLARGWEQDDEWWYSNDDGVYDYAPAWVSSTAFRDYLATRTDVATALTDDQRDKVKVGDIVQFDWDNSGDRDHTGVVTKVESTDSGTKIYYAGHTDNTDYRSVDYAIDEVHPGGDAYYWSLEL